MKIKGAFVLTSFFIGFSLLGAAERLASQTIQRQPAKQLLVVNFKKTYYSLSEAVRFMTVTNGCPSGNLTCMGINSTNNEKFLTEIKKHLHSVKSCSQNQDGCGPKNYKQYIEPNNADIVDSPFYTGDSMITADGVAWAFNGDEITVDITGNKPPNRAGRDIFTFIVVFPQSGKISIESILPIGSKQAFEYDGTATWENNCVKNGDGLFCAGRVLEQGKMDY